MERNNACSNNNILVSIICNTYNHEDYIADALDSFLMQRTNFVFEVLVHDDASTDKTAEIIKEYENRYPNLIKPIYRKENLYSRNLPNGQIERAKGKYIAFCEGDDYWIDSDKLQKQVDILEQYPECDVCAHAAYVVDAETKKRIGTISPRNNTGIIEVKDVIEGGGGFVSTNSLLIRKALFDKHFEFRGIFDIDYSLQIAASLRGGMLYLPDCMSAYRHMSKASWTVKIHTDVNKYCATMDLFVAMLQKLNQETEGKYSSSIEIMIRKYTVDKLEVQENYKEIFSNYRDVIKYKPLKSRVLLYLKAYFPLVLKIRNWRRND